MNFDSMPELHWDFGYPFALVVMILSVIVPLWYCRRKNWL
jgi:magnesium transporter